MFVHGLGLVLKPVSSLACKGDITLRRTTDSSKAENQYTRTMQLTILIVATIHKALWVTYSTKSEASYFPGFFLESFPKAVFSIPVTLNVELLRCNL